MLFDLKVSFLEKPGQNRVSIKKLVQTLNQRQNDAVHYITLKLYTSLGMIVSQVNQILKYTQENWREPT